MDDPIRRHPTRIEQLPVLCDVVAAVTRPGDRLLDLGCGTGFLEHHLWQAAPELRITGIDMKADSLQAARYNLAAHADKLTLVTGDLRAPHAIEVDAGPYQVVTSVLTFHDLDADEKQALIWWIAERLADNGFFLLYDRLRLTEPALYPLQLGIWRQIEQRFGAGMRTAENFVAYEADLGHANDPAGLKDYEAWFTAAGLAMAPLHIYGNVALIGGAKQQF